MTTQLATRRLVDASSTRILAAPCQRIFNSIDDGVNSPIDGLSQAGAKPPQRAQGKIELRNVSFRYPSRPDVEVCKVQCTHDG